jgi:hypothetical protein
MTHVNTLARLAELAATQLEVSCRCVDVFADLARLGLDAEAASEVYPQILELSESSAALAGFVNEAVIRQIEDTLAPRVGEVLSRMMQGESPQLSQEEGDTGMFLDLGMLDNAARIIKEMGGMVDEEDGDEDE